MDEKLCGRCRETKPVEEFYRDKSRKDGRQRVCKTCENERLKQYFRDNPRRRLGRKA